MKKAILAPLALLGLSACGPTTLYETVSVTLGDFSCSERVIINDQSNVGVSAGTAGENNFGNVRFDLPTSDVQSDADKRCQDALDIGEERARVKLEADKVDLELQRVRLEAERANMEVANADLLSEW